jgi:uncharacterized protein
MTADEIIRLLALAPHPEGGWYRQTWVAEGEDRPAGTCIYFLLRRGERSHWHRVDATEIWHYYAGAPIRLHISASDKGPRRRSPSGRTLPRARARRGSCPKGIGKRRRRRATGRLLAAPSVRGFGLRDLSWPRRSLPSPKVRNASQTPSPQEKTGAVAPVSLAVQAHFGVPPGFCLRPERRRRERTRAGPC